MGNTRKSKTWV